MREPDVVIHEILAGNTFSGVEPTGGSMADSLETIYQGRIRLYGSCDDAGLFATVAITGFLLSDVLYSGPGTTACAIYLVDMDGIEYLLHDETSNPASFTWSNPYSPLLVPPDWTVKVVTSGNISGGAVGRAVIYRNPGWGHVYFQDRT